ncbi:MAG: hypothetical protein LBO64_07765 [Desulfovibrio sp.]|nr:hypothetical protein [Desulfovibrio sp.]
MENEILRLCNAENVLKVMVSVNLDGTPHATVKSSVRYVDGNLLYYELIESSRTNRNVTAALWFDGTVRFLLVHPDGRSFQVAARPLRTCISGIEFREHYIKASKEFPSTDLAAVWIFEPLEITDQTLSTRIGQEREKRPYLTHLDRLAR